MTEKTVDGMVVVRNLLETCHKDEMREILARALSEVMDAEVSSLCGADRYERTDERTTYRNGYRPRTFDTRMGEIELSIPKVREGTYLPAFLEYRRRMEKAFVNVLSEAYVLGVSTRKVDKLVKAMGASGISKSQVSRIAAVLDEQVQDFLTRPIDEWYPYLWLDALYLKVREGSRVVSKAVFVAYGAGETGFRQVLGIEVADGEMEDAWQKFLGGLVQRGLKNVKLVISDAHQGLKNAIRGVFNGTSWQRCRVHFMRNVLCRVPKDSQNWVSAALKQVFAQQSKKDAKEAMHILNDQEKIDLLFCDVIMPGDMDGYQVALAAHEIHRSLKVLLTSGFTRKREENTYGEAPYLASLARNLLRKPYAYEDLANAVRRTLDGGPR